jgi:hypothetical protein
MANERTRKGDTDHSGGSAVDNHKVALAQIQIHERGGKFRTGTALSIAAVQIAGHHGKRDSHY